MIAEGLKKERAMNESQVRLITVLHAIAAEIHRTSEEHGFWPPEGRNKGEAIALMHSELSEMLEAVRKPKADDHCPEFSNEAIEAADLFIRLLDYCYGYDLHLGEALIAKMEFNHTRPHKHGKVF